MVTLQTPTLHIQEFGPTRSVVRMISSAWRAGLSSPSIRTGAAYRVPSASFVLKTASVVSGKSREGSGSGATVRGIDRGLIFLGEEDFARMFAGMSTAAVFALLVG